MPGNFLEFCVSQYRGSTPGKMPATTEYDKTDEATGTIKENIGGTSGLTPKTTSEMTPGITLGITPGMTGDDGKDQNSFYQLVVFSRRYCVAFGAFHRFLGHGK